MKIKNNKIENHISDGASYSAIFDAASDGIFIHDIETGRIIDVNQRACEMFCYPKKRLIGLGVGDLSAGVGPYNAEDGMKILKKAGLGEPQFFEWLAKDKALRQFWVEVNLKRAVIGGRYCLIAVVRDITERKQIEETLKESEERYRLIVENANELIMLTRPNGIISYMSPACATVLGYEPSELEGKEPWIIHPADSKKVKTVFAQAMKGGRGSDYRYRVRTKKGVIKWISHSWAPVLRDGKVRLVVSVIRDITDQTKAEKDKELLNREIMRTNKRLEQLVLKDFQTGLYNHQYLSEIIETEFYRAKRYAHPISVIMIDIDYFKSVNDVYGHKFGDLVLRQFAMYLKRMVRRDDIVVRYGGEEFVVISPGANRYRASMLAQRLLDSATMHTFGNKQHSIKLMLSIGVSSYPDDDNLNKGMDLIDSADRVLNKVKEVGGNAVFSSLELKKRKDSAPAARPEPADVRALKERIEKLNRKGKQSLIESIFAFAKTIELKDHYTGEHVESTVRYATEIARALDLPLEELENVSQAAVLHDLGKIGIDDKILFKKSKLSKKEFEEIKKHPQIAADIIRPIHFMHDIIPLVLYHHERWNGKGYPAALRGEEIPIGARIVAIADVYQALISKRPYRKAFSKKEAMKIIREGAGSQFDPRITDIFLKILSREKK